MAGLAVADAFTVESFYNGTHYSYVISMQDGIPVTLHLGDTPTTEKNGLKLSVNVDASSFKYYEEKASSLYKYFDYKPNINNSTIIMELETKHFSDDWFIQEKASRYDYNNYLVMAQVCYTIPKNSEIETHNFYNVVLKAPPGAVTFNPGRESLSLDKKTVAYVNQAMEKVKNDYVAASVMALAACKSDKDLVDCYYNITKSAPQNIIKDIDPTPFMSSELQNLVTSSPNGSFNIGYTDKFRQDTADVVQITSKPSYYKTARALDLRETIPLRKFFDAKHVIVDVKTNYKKTLNDHFEGEFVIFWQRTQGSDIDFAITKIKWYLTALNLSYSSASTIIGQYPSEEKCTIIRDGLYASPIDCNAQVLKATKIPNEEIKTEKYLYLPLKHTTPILQDESFTFKEYHLLYRYLSRIMDVPILKGVAKKYQNYVKDLDNWIDFETYIKDTIPQIVYRGEDDSIEGNEPVKGVLELINQLPAKIQQYIENLSAYKTFRQSDRFVTSSLKELLVRLGATEEKFSRPHAITTNDIKQDFPLTYNYSLNYKYNPFSATELIRIAKLEDFYALHSTE